VFPSVTFPVPFLLFLVFMELKELRKHKRVAELLSMNHHRHGEWTDGLFLELCILLQMAIAVQILPAAI
jgi:hypothetical protein